MTQNTFPNIEGIDSSAAIARCAGNVDLYKKILLSFCQSQADSPTTLITHFTNSEYSTLQSLAHAIKGAAANLGVTPVAETAKTVEQSIRNSGHCEEAQVQQLCDALRHSIDLLNQHLIPTSPDLEPVINLLKQSDPQATKSIEALIKESTDNNLSAKLRQALILCQLYQFDEALDALQ
ncbi:Hpt domain-containing protein [Rubritalea tangerina]|uniref:Hpt domain-containing protein n=1 Tax=Rubritalea tangerina TaxID=430798 RepID=A0ABW4Z9J7_9BACT